MRKTRGGSTKKRLTKGAPLKKAPPKQAQPKQAQPKQAQPKQERLAAANWVEAATQSLAGGGVAEVRVERLAKNLKVTKGSFYWHFKSRRELLDAVLVRWEEVGTSRIIDRVDEAHQEPHERLHHLFSLALGSPETDLLEVRIRSWAGEDGLARKAVARVDQKRLRYVRALLKDAGIDRERAKLRANIVYRVMIGEATWRASGGVKGNPQMAKEVVAMVTSGDQGA